jgi:hypothetical protein
VSTLASSAPPSIEERMSSSLRRAAFSSFVCAFPLLSASPARSMT